MRLGRAAAPRCSRGTGGKLLEAFLRSPFGESCSCRHTGAMVDGRAALQPRMLRIGFVFPYSAAASW
eukprot:6165224-Alexandrium_andersonii.AAC.1